MVANQLTLNYPYKAATSATCSYPNLSGGGTKTPTHGYCPIVRGMTEYKDYLRTLITFLSRADAQAWTWLPTSAYKTI